MLSALRGPTGIIGTNRADSVATVSSLLEDIKKLNTIEPKSGAEGACKLLQERGIRYVSFSEWKKIDTSEIERGASKNKPREKYTRTDEMLELLG